MNGVLLTCAVALWTLCAGGFLIMGLFGAADSRCNGESPRVDMDGGWMVIATVCLWAAPFVVIAVRRTSVVSVITALITVVLAAAVVINMFRSPSTFCF